jgi:hypothetical protein
MAKNDTSKMTYPDAVAAVAAGSIGIDEAKRLSDPAPPPALGSTCAVQVAPGLTLMNNETGAYFLPGEPTAQTVTLTLLRRLADGDLVQVA